jgi:8-oxo-dGTP diphosphatase
MTHHSPELRPLVGVGVLIIENDRLLLVKRRGSHGEGTFGSLGGHVEFGESPEAALCREAREELGIELGHIRFLACNSLVMYGRHYLDLGFQAEIAAGTPQIQPAEVHKMESIGWYDLNDLPQPLFPPLELYLEALRTGQSYFHRELPWLDEKPT